VTLVDERLLARMGRMGILGPRSAELRAGDFYASALGCGRCAGVWYLSRVNPGSWNRVVSYLSGGLLYGREVPKPAGWHDARKLAYRPKSRGREARRRGQVLRRVLNGWTAQRIARDLGITVMGVRKHVWELCRQEGVRDRHELARRLGSGHAQPLNVFERAARRRERVMELLRAGRTYRAIAAEVGVGFRTVAGDVHAIYRAHGLVGVRGGRVREKLREGRGARGEGRGTRDKRGAG
jgi:DNA-binding CsgD family transcriptional regulator